MISSVCTNKLTLLTASGQNKASFYEVCVLSTAKSKVWVECTNRMAWGTNLLKQDKHCSHCGLRKQKNLCARFHQLQCNETYKKPIEDVSKL